MNKRGANSYWISCRQTLKLRVNLDNSNKIIKKYFHHKFNDYGEKLNPNILKFSRKRISKGSGCSLQDINVLIKQFQDAQKMIKLIVTTKVYKQIFIVN